MRRHPSAFLIPVSKPKIRQDRDNLKLTAVYGTPTREKVLSAFIRTTCSSLRNSLREMVSRMFVLPSLLYTHCAVTRQRCRRFEQAVG